MQTAAAIFQVLPSSSIFRLPALAGSDVQNWMKSVFPTELVILQASAGSPVDLMRIQNEAMRQALEENRVQLRELRLELAGMRQSFDRRTAILSPAKAYSHQTYADTCMLSLIPYSYSSQLILNNQCLVCLNHPTMTLLFQVLRLSQSHLQESGLILHS